ncbi:MAG: hypothetical protein MJE63_27515 [Proteobacteria bacterium]|nr:hypothetical protein [Pseudomonadota bacterium]
MPFTNQSSRQVTSTQTFLANDSFADKAITGNLADAFCDVAAGKQRADDGVLVNNPAMLIRTYLGDIPTNKSKVFNRKNNMPTMLENHSFQFDP